MKKDSATYHKLITAAAECFAEKGFKSSSVREIATRAGISQGAMYTYFKSKEELISAIVLEEQKSALNAQNESFSGTYLERICLLVSSCISDVGYPATHHLWVEIIAESSRNASLRHTFISSDIAMRHGIGNIIQEGMCRGEFRKDIVVEEITIILFAIIDGLIARKAINKDFSSGKDLTTFSQVLQRLLT